MTHLIHTRENRKDLAYRLTKPDPSKENRCSFVWLSGFRSDMTGTKVVELEAWAQQHGHGFLAFDYTGHGVSDGEFAESNIGVWRQDVLDMIDALTEGPQILVGSSMGGWMALLAAVARPDNVAGLVLSAPAPDFTEKLMWPGLSTEEQTAILEAGVYLQPSDYGDPLPLTRHLFEDGKRWQLLDELISFDGPVRILQGMQDPDVPWEHAKRLVMGMSSEDIVFNLVKDGDHRLSRPQDIRRLLSTCDEITTAFVT